MSARIYSFTPPSRSDRSPSNQASRWSIWHSPSGCIHEPSYYVVSPRFFELPESKQCYLHQEPTERGDLAGAFVCRELAEVLMEVINDPPNRPSTPSKRFSYGEGHSEGRLHFDDWEAGDRIRADLRAPLLNALDIRHDAICERHKRTCNDEIVSDLLADLKKDRSGLAIFEVVLELYRAGQRPSSVREVMSRVGEVLHYRIEEVDRLGSEIFDAIPRA